MVVRWEAEIGIESLIFFGLFSSMLLVYAPTVGRFCRKSNTWNRSAQHTLKIAK